MAKPDKLDTLTGLARKIDTRLTKVSTRLVKMDHRMERSFAAVTSDISHRPTNSSVAHIVKNQLIDFADKYTIPQGEQLTSIEGELKTLRADLSTLKEKVDNASGYGKEIDHAFERIAAIEKHLGLDNKIAA
jgi:hypothetical protein